MLEYNKIADNRKLCVLNKHTILAMKETFVKLPTFERRNEIIKLLVEQGYVKAQELAVHFEVSMETIRTDLLHLEKSGMVSKEHGGASLIQIDEEHHLQVRLEHTAKKQQIAKFALTLLDDAKIIFIDAGSTVYELALLLNAYRPLDIITNSSLVWDILDGEHHNVFLTGGKKRQKNMSLTGSWCTQAIASVHADVCFLGTSGILERKGPTTHSYQELEAKKMMVAQSDRIYVLADSHKFKESGFHTLCSWDEIDGIVCDDGLSSQVYERYRKQVPIFMAQEESDEENS